MPFETPSDAHLDPVEVAAYVDHSVRSDQRDRITRHLVTCAACRAEVVQVERWQRDARLRRRSLLGGAGLAAAAAVAGLLLVHPASLSQRVRGVGPTAPERAGPVGPEVGGPLRAWGTPATSTARPILGWAGAGVAEAQYEVTVVDSAGHPRWTAATAETTATVPDSVRLVPGTYYWHADALLPDGRTRTTGTQTLTVPR